MGDWIGINHDGKKRTGLCLYKQMNQDTYAGDSNYRSGVEAGKGRLTFIEKFLIMIIIAIIFGCIQEPQYVTDKYGNRKKQLVTIATVWAYFRQLSVNEIYRVTTQTEETVLFQIGYRTDISTNCNIIYKGKT